MRASGLILCLSALLTAGEADVALPLAPRAGKKQAYPRVVVHLTKDGRVRIDPDAWPAPGLGDVFRKPKLRDVTLDELGTHLDRSKRYYDLRQQAGGGSGLDDVAPGVKMSALHVLLRADADTPWAHVDLLMTIFAEQKYYKLQLAAKRDGKELALDAFLPTDASPQLVPQEPRTDIRVPVTIVADAKSAAFVFANRERKDLSGFEEYLRTAKSAAGKDVTLIGEIKASRKAPVRHAIAALDLFRAEGYEHVHMYGIEIPDPKARRLEKLPPPENNDVSRSVSGTAGIDWEPEEPD